MLAAEIPMMLVPRRREDIMVLGLTEIPVKIIIDSLALKVDAVGEAEDLKWSFWGHWLGSCVRNFLDSAVIGRRWLA